MYVLQTNNRLLKKQLLKQEQTSNSLLDAIGLDADRMITEAHDETMATRNALLIQQSQNREAVRHERHWAYKVNVDLREEHTQSVEVLTDLHALELYNVSTTFNKKIYQALLQISQERKMWKVLAGDYKRIADISGEALLAKKQSCCNRIQDQLYKSAALEERFNAEKERLVEQLMVVQRQLRQKRKEHKLEKNLKAQSYKRSHKRLVQKRTAEYKVKSLKDEAEEMIEEMVLKDCDIDQLSRRLRQSMPKELRRVHTKGGGGSHWDLWAVQLCIMFFDATT